MASADAGRLRNRRAAQDVAEYLDVARRPADVAPEASGVLSNTNPNPDPDPNPEPNPEPLTLTLSLTLTLTLTLTLNL